MNDPDVDKRKRGFGSESAAESSDGPERPARRPGRTHRDARQEALAWLQLYRDLGVEAVRVPPEKAPSEAVGARPNPEPDSVGARPNPEPPAGGDGGGRPAPPPTFDAHAILGPARSLTDDALSDHERLKELIDLHDPPRALDILRNEVIGDCTRCGLCKGRNKLVFGVGHPDARLMFVGEGPGADEDRQGEPFVGRAGQLLDRIIAAMGLTRSQVYIANVVKCRPPDNRVPLPDEAATCVPFLRAQIAIIRPEAIVALGRTALEGLLGEKVPSMSRVRGQWMSFEGIPLLPTFHPAYLLRSPQAKRPVWEDMKNVLRHLELPIP